AVEVHLSRAQFWMAIVAVPARIEIRAARDAQPSQSREQPVDRGGSERRHHDGYPAGRLDGARVSHAERHFDAGRVALAGRVGVLGGAYLGGGDADQRALMRHRRTQVSFPPPFFELLTISESRSSATRVRPPGTTYVPR